MPKTPNPKNCKRGWKVTCLDRTSIILLNLCHHQTVWGFHKKYPPNVWVTPSPGCGPLGVFADTQLAENFASVISYNITSSPDNALVLPCLYIEAESYLYFTPRGRYWGIHPVGGIQASAVMCLE